MPSGGLVRAGTKIISRGLLVSVWVMVSMKFCAGAKRIDRALLYVMVRTIIRRLKQIPLFPS